MVPSPAVSTPHAMPPVALSFVRWSTPQQALGDSLRRQLALSEDFAKRHGLRLDPSLSITQAGVSAFRQSPVVALVEAVKAGRIPSSAWVLVESLDRLS